MDPVKTHMVRGKVFEERRNRPEGPAETTRVKSSCVSRTLVTKLVLFPAQCVKKYMADIPQEVNVQQIKVDWALSVGGDHNPKAWRDGKVSEQAMQGECSTSTRYRTRGKKIVKKFAHHMRKNKLTIKEIREKAQAKLERKESRIDPDFAIAYMKKAVDTTPLKYIPFLYKGLEVADTTAAAAITKVLGLNHASIACMVYDQNHKIFVGVVLETAVEQLENSEFNRDFGLLSPVDLKTYKSTLWEIFDCVESEKCWLKSERLVFSMGKLAEHVNKQQDVSETVKLLVPKGYDMERYNKSFS